MSNDSYFTCDYNGYIDPTELALIEKEVNKIIYEQKIVKTYYPDNIDELEYRSKKELSSKVRIFIPFSWIFYINRFFIL